MQSASTSISNAPSGPLGASTSRVWWRAHLSELTVLTAFALSRLLYAWAGLRFDSAPLGYFWQYIDPELMRHDLLRSLFYLHMQPPGFNLLIGLALKLFPDRYGGALHSLYIALGIAAALALLDLLKRFRVQTSLRTILVVFFFTSPACVLFENFLSYDYITPCLLLIAAWLLFLLVDRPTFGRSLGFFTILLAASLLRNQFHLLYLAVVAGALLMVRPRFWRPIAAGAAPLFAATLLLYLKNFLIVGAFNASTWVGMQTAVMTTHNLSPTEIDSLVESKVLTPIARIPEFSSLRDYRGFYVPPPPTGVKILDNENSTNHPNFNNPGYLQIHKQYLANSMALLRNRPSVYLRGFRIAWFTYFLPASDFFQFYQLPDLQPFERIYSVAVFGQFQRGTHAELRALSALGGGPLALLPYTGVFLIILLPALYIWGAAQLAFSKPRRAWTLPESFTIGFLLFTIAWITALTNLLSAFENHRYRFSIDGYFVILGALLLSCLLGRRAILRYP